MKNFFKTIPQTVWSPSFYREVLETASLKKSLSFFFIIVTVVSIVGGLTGAFGLLKIAEKVHVRELVANAVAKYPEGYTLSIKAGVASSSRATPVLLTSADLGIPNTACLSSVTTCTILTIDTSRNPSLEEVLTSGSRAWIAKNFAYTVNDRGHVEAQSLASYNDFAITKARATELAGYLTSFLDAAYPYLATIFALFSFVAFSCYILAALAAALILLAIGKWSNWTYSYRQYFVASLYAATLPIILSAFVVLVSLPFPGTLSLIVMLAIVLGNIKVGKK